MYIYLGTKSLYQLPIFGLPRNRYNILCYIMNSNLMSIPRLKKYIPSLHATNYSKKQSRGKL